MPTPAKRSYSRYTREALILLGRQIQLGRKQRALTAAELAQRIGISRSTLHRIEAGDSKVEIGVVFEAATIVGLPLFGQDTHQLSAILARTDERLAVLPRHVYPRTSEVSDDF
jgi:transcriptional regulator with XRE-family HTH domain